MDALWIWIGVAVYVALALVAAVASRRGRSASMSGYFLGDRKMGGFVSAMSYSATTYSAFMMIGLAGLTYAGGVGALGFELLYLCGVVLLFIFGPRFWRVGKEYGYVTPSEMLGHRYDSRPAGAVTAIASCVFLIPYSAVQLAGVGYLLSGMSGGDISFTAGTILATALAIIFALVAGLRSVAWTDSLQSIVMIISASLVVILVIWQLGGPGSFFNSLASEPGALSVPGNGYFTFSTFLALTLPWMFFMISNPQVSQRLYTPRSLRELRKMLIGFMAFGFVYTLISVVWGLTAMLQFDDLDSGDQATPSLLSSELVPTVLGVTVMVGIMAAAVSTIDSIMLTLSSMLTRDVYAVADRRTTEKKQLLVGRLILPVIAVGAYWFAHLELDLIAVLSVSASAGLLVMVPPIVGAFFWKRGTATGAIVSITVAGLVVLALEYSGTLFLGQGSGIWGLLVSSFLFVSVSLVTTPEQNRAADFIEHSKGKSAPEAESGSTPGR